MATILAFQIWPPELLTVYLNLTVPSDTAVTSLNENQESILVFTVFPPDRKSTRLNSSH